MYAFGVILLNLISKRVYESETRGNYGEDVCLHAWKEYCAYEISCIQMNDWKKIKFSVVHDNLKADPDFEPADEYKISELFIDCTESDPSDRPNMRQVLRSLFKLKSCEEKCSSSWSKPSLICVINKWRKQRVPL